MYFSTSHPIHHGASMDIYNFGKDSCESQEMNFPKNTHPLPPTWKLSQKSKVPTKFFKISEIPNFEKFPIPEPLKCQEINTKSQKSLPKSISKNILKMGTSSEKCLYISALKSQKLLMYCRDFEILKIRLDKMGDEHLHKKISINWRRQHQFNQPFQSWLWQFTLKNEWRFSTEFNSSFNCMVFTIWTKAGIRVDSDTSSNLDWKFLTGGMIGHSQYRYRAFE